MTNVWCDVNDALLFLVTEIKTPHGILYKILNLYYGACDVTLSVYPHRASLKNMPGHGVNRTYDLWNIRTAVVIFKINLTPTPSLTLTDKGLIRGRPFNF